MASTDLQAADALRGIMGWNQTLEDWHRILSLEPCGCFVAMRDQQVAGTVTTTTYDEMLAWIGMMLVHPAQQRHGIGTRLMQQALDYLRSRKVVCIKLDATPAGQPLYEKLGFVPEGGLKRYRRAGFAQHTDCSRGHTRDVDEADWRCLSELDKAAFGINRGRLLQSFAFRRALIRCEDGRIVGYGLLRPGANADYLGPVVALSIAAAGSLISVLLEAAGDRPVIWDIFDQNDSARELAGHLGFAPVRPLTRMRLGPNTMAAKVESQFAIADPALG